MREDVPARIGDLPAWAAGRWGAREAVVAGDVRWSFARFDEEVERAARALLALGVEPGDRIAVWLVNRSEWLALFYAVPRVGAVLVPLNTRFRSDDLAFVVGHSGAAVLVQHDVSGPVDFLELTRAAIPGLEGDPRFPQLRHVVAVSEREHGGVLRWEDCLAAGEQVPRDAVAARAASVDPEATAMILYTSGTTGFPKGAMHNHRCVRTQLDRAERLGITEEDTFLCFLPLFHLYGLADMGLMFSITGSRIVLTETFDPDECVRLIESERATMVHGFDAHYQGLLEAGERLGTSFGSMRLCSIPAGMESSLPIARRIPAEICPAVSAYGLTEGWCCAAIGLPPANEELLTETSGYPMPGYEFRIVDPASGRDLPPREPGEILLRSFMVTQGYYRQPEATAAAIDPDGWLHTGDMGYLREDGYLRFLGRFKDMLKVGGENVSPMEVEGYLLERFPLEAVAVVGYPDERLQEVAVAFVVCREGWHGDAARFEEELIEACRGRIASFKLPRRVLVVDAMPMTASGKIQKHLLRTLALELLGDPRSVGS